MPLSDKYLLSGRVYTLEGEACKWDGEYLVLISEGGMQPKYYALPEEPPRVFIVITNEKGEREYLERTDAESTTPGDVDSGVSPE